MVYIAIRFLEVPLNVNGIERLSESIDYLSALSIQGKADGYIIKNKDLLKRFNKDAYDSLLIAADGAISDKIRDELRIILSDPKHSSLRIDDEFPLMKKKIRYNARFSIRAKQKK